MSNEYIVHKDEYSELVVYERSNKLTVYVDTPSKSEQIYTTEPMTVDQFRTAIIKQIEVLSYFVDDADEVLKRFNVTRGQTR